MKTRSKQQGYALLIFVALLITASAALAVKALKHRSGYTQIARDRITADALAQAKDALIGYAITYGDTHPGNVHGYLPCPDTSGTDIGGEGAAAGSCGPKNVSSIGKLPWKTLDLSVLRGGDSECLWYAVSGTYKYNPPSDLMNWDTNGQLQVYASNGTTLLTPADNQAVAVIFAPGTAAPGQDRYGTTAPLCGGNYTASNYLDTNGTFNNATVSATANANSAFRFGISTAQTSDRMVFITKQDVWNAMKKREAALMVKLDTMTLQVAQCIANFGRNNQISGTPNILNKSLPWPAPLSLTDYTDNTQYNDHDELYSGRVPYKVNTSRVPTHNLISSDYLLTQGTYNDITHHWENGNCPAPDGWAAIYPWWNNWKDHLFYAVSQRFKPDSSATNACDSSHCLSVNSSPGNPSNNAAVVMFAGKPLSSQTRTDKSIISNYLEGLNNSNMAGFANGNENYQLDVTSGTFNDIVYCIKDDLKVVKGDPLATPVCPL